MNLSIVPKVLLILLVQENVHPDTTVLSVKKLRVQLEHIAQETVIGILFLAHQDGSVRWLLYPNVRLVQRALSVQDSVVSIPPFVLLDMLARRIS